MRRPQSRRADGLLLLIAYPAAASATPTIRRACCPLPAFGLFVLLRRPATLLRWKLIVGCAAVLFLGLTPFAIQPIRAAHFPGINEGEPTACLNGPQVGCTLQRARRATLHVAIIQARTVRRATRGRAAGAHSTRRSGMWWLYFKWQWMRDAWNERPACRAALAVLFLALGVAGRRRALPARPRRRSRSSARSSSRSRRAHRLPQLQVRALAGPRAGRQSVPREVRDRDYFYLWSFATWGALGRTRRGRHLAVGRATRATRAAPARGSWPRRCCSSRCVPLVTNARDASREGQTFTADWARDLLQSVEPYGILITAGDNDSFPVWYAQQVEGVRRDVTIALIPYLNMEWYAHQLIRERVAPYDGSGIAAYAALAGEQPTGPVIAPHPGAGRLHAAVPATHPAGRLQAGRHRGHHPGRHGHSRPADGAAVHQGRLPRATDPLLHRPIRPVDGAWRVRRHAGTHPAPARPARPARIRPM